MTSVSSWITRGSDQSKLFQAQPTITTTTSSGASGTNPITIDKTVTYQSMIGFGAALTDSAAYTIWSMPSSARSALMTELFDPTNGYGISCLRLTIGACDFSRGPYTYDDNGGNADTSLANFAITHDLDAVVPLAKAALALNPGLRFIASCWSPPAWMKTGGLNGGTLNPTYYSVYAQYLVKYCQAYAAQGIPIWGISVANEPENGTSAYPSTPMTAAQQVTLIGQYVGPAFKSAGLSTKILAYDHNWNDTSYPETVISDNTAGPYVDGVAWHAYAGDVSAQTTVHNAYPAKNAYFTEITASQPGSFQGDLQWHCRNIVLGAPNNWARLTTHWNLALNENNGPLNGGYSSGQGLVQVNSSTNVVTRYGPYWAVVHSSAKVKPGAQRISCTNPGTGYVVATAYLNPDGSRVAVFECDAQSTQTFQVIEGGQQFTATMQPGDVATYVFPAPAASTPIPGVPNDQYGIYAGPLTPPFTNSFWTQSGVPTAPLHANSAAIVAELVNDLAAYGGTAAFNAHQDNTSIVYAPVGTPRVTVGFFDQQRKGTQPASFAAVCASVPVPAGTLPASGTDGELTIIDLSTSPATVYEFWQWAHYDTTTQVPNGSYTATRPAGYSACWGGMTTVDGPGYFTGGLGASASECAVLGGVIGIREAQVSFANGHASLGHTLNMATNTVGPASKAQWPAQNGDGSGSSPSLIQEGQWFRLDPTLSLTGLGLTNIGYMVARTMQTHGVIVTDQAGAVSIIGESPNQVVGQGLTDPWIALKAPLTANQDYVVLQNFPWSHLQALQPNWGEYPGSPTWTNSQLNVYQGSTIVATATSVGTAQTIVTAINSNSSGSQYTVTGTANITRVSTGAVIATGTTPANAATVVAALNTAYQGGPTPVASVTATGNTSPIQVTGLTPGKYTLQVAAVNGAGTGPQSAASAAVTIPAPAPTTSTLKHSAWTGSVSYENSFLQTITGQTTDKSRWWGRNYASHDIKDISNPSGVYSAWKSAGYTGFIMGTPLAGSGYSCSQVANGAADSIIRAFVAQFQKDWPNGTGVVELGWETNIAGEYYWCLANKDGSTQVANADYKGAFDHFASIVHANSALLVDWTVSTQSGAVPSAARPSPVSVDTYGADAYDTYYGSDSQTGASRWNKVVNNGGETLANVINQAKSQGKRWSVNEWGVSPSNNGSGGGDDPHYMQNMLALLKTGNDLDGLVKSGLPAAYDSYYSASYDLLNGYPNSLAAYKAGY